MCVIQSREARNIGYDAHLSDLPFMKLRCPPVRLPLSLCFVFLLSACTASTGLQQSTTALETAINGQVVEYPESGFQGAPSSPSPAVINAQLWFPAIAGHFYGTPNLQKSWHASLDEAGGFQLPSTTQIEQELSKLARPFDEQETAILVEPAATRVARLKTYVISEFDGEAVGTARWQASKHRSELLLVYFDRPCQVLGSLFFAGQEHRFDVRVPEAGLYWLARRHSLFGVRPYRAVALTQPVVAVAPPSTTAVE